SGFKGTRQTARGRIPSLGRGREEVGRQRKVGAFFSIACRSRVPVSRRHSAAILTPRFEELAGSIAAKLPASHHKHGVLTVGKQLGGVREWGLSDLESIREPRSAVDRDRRSAGVLRRRDGWVGRGPAWQRDSGRVAISGLWLQPPQRKDRRANFVAELRHYPSEESSKVSAV